MDESKADAEPATGAPAATSAPAELTEAQRKKAEALAHIFSDDRVNSSKGGKLVAQIGRLIVGFLPPAPLPEELRNSTAVTDDA